MVTDPNHGALNIIKVYLKVLCRFVMLALENEIVEEEIEGNRGMLINKSE